MKDSREPRSVAGLGQIMKLEHWKSDSGKLKVVYDLSAHSSKLQPQGRYKKTREC